MSYGVKSVFNTLQGEGARAGTRAVFVRFTGCNMWNGLPAAREKGEGACAKWCDTDFFKGQINKLDQLLARMDTFWPAATSAQRWCVLTGGEPCLQIDEPLLVALHQKGWRVAVETNGTVENMAVRTHADWVCIAPKLDAKGQPTKLVFAMCNEVKVVLPGVVNGVGWTPEMMAKLEYLAPRGHLFVQPMDPLIRQEFVSETALVNRQNHDDLDVVRANVRAQENEKACIEFVMKNPQWRLGAQLHKTWGLE